METDRQFGWQSILERNIPNPYQNRSRSSEKNWYDEQVKAFLYRQKINIQTSDDSDIKLKVIQEFDIKIKQLKNKTAKAILTIQQARNYSDYFINNYYSINQRTEVQGGTKEDFTFGQADNLKTKSNLCIKMP